MSHEVRMPRLSQDMESGQVVEWLRAEGDTVQEGDPILVVETDKANMDIEAPASGVLRRVLAAVGDDVAIGSVLAIIAGADEELAEPASASPSPAADRPATTAVPPAGATPAATGRETAPTKHPPGRQPASPAARRVAAELGIDLADVRGSGEGGLVTEADVRAASQQAPARPETGEAGAADVTEVPLIGARRRIAERMALSRRTVADVTTVIDVDMTRVAALRERSGLPYTAYVAWATARSLATFPALNATFRDDRLFLHRRIHLGVAVARDDGLVVPVIRDADQRSVSELASAIEDLAAAARDGEARPEDLTGSTFTLTNSGTYGSLFFTPIVNTPEVAILGMGRVAEMPVVRQGVVVPGRVMYLCLSYDHRVVDGADAVSFVADVKARLEGLEADDA